MIEFNTAIMAGWMLFGYKALRIYNFSDYFIIEPTIDVDLEDCGSNYYTVEFHEEQVYHIANSVGVLQLKFYVDVDHIDSELNNEQAFYCRF